MERTFDKRLLIGIVLIVAVMIIYGGLACHNIQRLYATNSQVIHTYEVLASVQQVLSAVKDAETGQRGFVLTGNPRYLAPFEAASADIADDLRRAEQLTRDNPDQQARLKSLQQHVQSKLNELQTTIDLRRNEGFEAAQRIVQTDAGKKDMDAIRAIIAEMEETEQDLLALRADEARTSRDIAMASSVVAAALGLLMVGVFVALLRRHLRARIAAADVLQSQKELYRTTLTSIGDAVITTDAAGRVSLLNEVAQRLTGWQNAEAQGLALQDIFRIVNEETRSPVENPAERALAEGVIVGLANHTLLIAKDGQERPIDDSAAPIRDGAGRQVGAVLVFRDITERKRVEQSLRFLAQASATLSTLVDYQSTLQNIAGLAVPSFADWCLVDVLDAKGMPVRLAVAHADPAKARWGRELAERYPVDLRRPYGTSHVVLTGVSELVPEVSEAMLAKRACNAEHLEALKRLHLRSYLCVPLKSQDRVLGAITFLTAESGRRFSEFELDVAEDLASRATVAIENARLYRDLREADVRKDEFLAMLAHELRNPLAPIRNALELLTPETDADTAQWARSLMQRQVQHIVRLVDDLLDVSRVMRGKIQLKKEQVEVGSAIHHAVEEVKPALESQEQEFSLSLPDEPLWVHGDPNRLSQIVSNLLANAVKYSDRKQKIALSVTRENGQVTIAVRDTGIGIAPDMLLRIFEPFTQITDALDRSRGGLGIGLALVKNLVEMHEGTVTAHSLGSGQGSEFFVRLPLVSHADVPLAAEWKPTPVPVRKVLVVDDNLGAAQTLAKLLTKFWGHRVEMTYDGRSALQKVEQFHPDVILLDIGLPGLNGYEVAARLRALPQFDRILLVALTGYGQDEDRRRSTEAGFDEHLVKPVSVMSLQALFAHPKLVAA